MLNVTALLGSSVVVSNCTRRHDLECRHCSSDSTSRRDDGLDTEEAMAFVADIAEFGSPALLLSGGEPSCAPT